MTSFFYETLLIYSLCCLCLCLSSFGAFHVFLVSRPIPDFYTKIPAFYANITCYRGFYARYYVWCAVGGGGPCVARGCLQPFIWCNSGVQFNMLDRFMVPGPSPAPVPAGDWVVKLRGSSVSRTSQWRL